MRLAINRYGRKPEDSSAEIHLSLGLNRSQVASLPIPGIFFFDASHGDSGAALAAKSPDTLTPVPLESIGPGLSRVHYEKAAGDRFPTGMSVLHFSGPWNEGISKKFIHDCERYLQKLSVRSAVLLSSRQWQGNNWCDGPLCVWNQQQWISAYVPPGVAGWLEIEWDSLNEPAKPSHDVYKTMELRLDHTSWNTLSCALFHQLGHATEDQVIEVGPLPNMDWRQGVALALLRHTYPKLEIVISSGAQSAAVRRLCQNLGVAYKQSPKLDPVSKLHWDLPGFVSLFSEEAWSSLASHIQKQAELIPKALFSSL